MSDIHPRPLSDEESAQGTATAEDTKTRNSEPKSWKEERLVVLRTLLKSRRDRENTMREIEREELPNGKNGPALIGSGSERLENSGMSAGLPENRQNMSERPEKMLTVQKPADQEPRSVLPDESLNNTSPISGAIVSESMSLLDDASTHIFDLMKGLHANQPAAEVKAFDPERVNSAVNCANTLYKMMRLKLDAIKIQRKIVK